MIPRRQFLGLAAGAAALLALSGAARAQEPLPVVASFSILADMTSRIGAEHVAVSSLVGPGGDAHVFEPTPADARLLGKAKLLVTNGLQFEGWLPRLVSTSGFAGETVVASTGVKPLAFADEAHEAHDDHAEHGDHDDHDHAAEHHDGHDHGPNDPHAWQDLANGQIYARNITEALKAADPANASDYERNGAAYIAEMAALNREIHAELDAVPAARRKVVTSHDAFGYFGRAYGIAFIAPNGVSTESEASAADVARIIDQIRADGIRAVFVENISDPRLVQRIAAETGAEIGGSLFSDSLSEPGGPAATYLDMFRHNAAELARALGTS
ncbi:metal ABC transporter substrate-binding protein [Aureimonas flava]|uniref:Metal ABC transporter substrate-binding protein n=1 Tax=Aureimonas flava TaxID=2320271 RepID=A0A3A1WVR9_9HYPH|nr:metal ABC transporter substrate-binding protein [Aureimonas flava]RIY02438.1 metal ABC transporter substrate-binding protein [Aureimonas flava]